MALILAEIASASASVAYARKVNAANPAITQVRLLRYIVTTRGAHPSIKDAENHRAVTCSWSRADIACSRRYQCFVGGGNILSQHSLILGFDVAHQLLQYVEFFGLRSGNARGISVHIAHQAQQALRDRKSTRLNSSHPSI